MSILSDELTNDPLGRGYSGMTDAEAAAALNAADRPSVRPVSNKKYLKWLAGTRRKKIADAAAVHSSATVQGLAQMALDMILRADVDYVRGDHEAMLDGLVAGGVLDADDKGALDDLADIQISRAEELGLSLVGDQHVKRARM